jgi:hypothetical protein
MKRILCRVHPSGLWDIQDHGDGNKKVATDTGPCGRKQRWQCKEERKDKKNDGKEKEGTSRERNGSERTKTRNLVQHPA